MKQKTGRGRESVWKRRGGEEINGRNQEEEGEEETRSQAELFWTLPPANPLLNPSSRWRLAGTSTWPPEEKDEGRERKVNMREEKNGGWLEAGERKEK